MTVRPPSPARASNNGNHARFVTVPPSVPPTRTDYAFNQSALAAERAAEARETRIVMGCFGVLGLFIMFVIMVLVSVPIEYGVAITQISGLNTTSSVINTDVAFVITPREANNDHHYHEMSIHVKVNGETISGGLISLNPSNKVTPFSRVISSGPWPLSSETLAYVTNNVKNLALSVKTKAHGEHDAPDDCVKCEMNVDLTRTTGSQLIYRHCYEVD